MYTYNIYNTYNLLNENEKDWEKIVTVYKSN